MKFLIWAAALAGIVMGQGAARADEIPGASFVVGTWRGSGHTINGRFAYCVAIQVDYSGFSTGIAVTKEGVARITWVNAAFRFSAGNRLPVSLSIDNAAPPMALTAVALSRAVVEIDLPGQARFFPQLMQGRTLAMAIDGRRYEIDVKGMYAALMACVVSQVSAAARKPAPGTRPATPPAQTPDAQEAAADRKETDALVTRILKRPVMSAFSIVPPAERYRLPAPYADRTVWYSGEITGMLAIVRAEPGMDTPEAASIILKDDTRRCTNGPSAAGYRDDVPTGAAKRVFSVCRRDGRDLVTMRTIVPRSDGSYYVFTTAGLLENDGRKALNDAEDALRQAILEVLNR